MTSVNLHSFIKEEKVCNVIGCKYNQIGICECFNPMFLNDIIVKSSDLLNVKNPESVEYECFMAKSKLNTCLYCGKELDYWKEDSGEEWNGCSCGE